MDMFGDGWTGGAVRQRPTDKPTENLSECNDCNVILHIFPWKCGALGGSKGACGHLGSRLLVALTKKLTLNNYIGGVMAYYLCHSGTAVAGSCQPEICQY